MGDRWKDYEREYNIEEGGLQWGYGFGDDWGWDEVEFFLPWPPKVKDR